MADKRFGAVVVFKEGVTKNEASLALLRLAPMLDYGTFEGLMRAVGVVMFDADEGRPVWYIP